MNNYFEHKFKERYIHCDFDGRAFVRACAPGTVWNQAVLTCTPERLLLNLTSRLDGVSQSYGGYGNSYQAPQSSYGGYQTPSVAVPVNVAPVQTPSYAAIQQPQVVVNQPTTNYGGYQQVVDVPKITETSTQGNLLRIIVFGKNFNFCLRIRRLSISGQQHSGHLPTGPIS